MPKRLLLLAAVVVVNLALGALALIQSGAPAAPVRTLPHNVVAPPTAPVIFAYSAQTGDSGPIAPDAQPVYDPLPAANAPGALAYTIADSWDRVDLSFTILNCPSTVGCRDGQEAVREAFRGWQSVSALRFTEVEPAQPADIEVQWAIDYQILGEPGGVLAYALLPRDGGDLFLDDSEPWSIGDGGDFDLIVVAAHEIGHTLGLDHSDDPYALMYPTVTRFTTYIEQDDIAAVQALYGPPDGSGATTNTNQPPASIEPGAGEDGFISDQTSYEIWEVDVAAGESITAQMTTVRGNLDPYLGILTYDEDTVLAEAGDDDDNGTVSLTYTFDTAGTYLIVATRFGTFDGETSGAYRLDVEFADDPAAVPASDNGTPTVTFENASGVDLCELYFSSSYSDEWGENYLGGDYLADGEALDLTDVEPGTYDVLVYDCDGGYLEQYEIGVTSSKTIRIYPEFFEIAG